jgi:anti-sigma28 factor (negative regulator of flagellin synthesis)
MRVDNGGVNGPGADFYTRTETTTSKEAGKKGSGSATQSDRTSLSATDELVGLAKTLVPAGRTGQVSVISAALSSGTYNADPSAISEALVNEHIQG